MIHIIDAGIGNFSSVANMLDYLDIDNLVIQDPNQISNPSHLIVPGVGAFDHGMTQLKRTGWANFLQNIDSDIKILGICLGMQLLGNKSEEGKLNGLGLVDLYSKRFNTTSLPVPHMGWNSVKVNGDNVLFKNENKNSRFYFSHSYYAVSSMNFDESMMTTYGSEFLSGFAHGNIFGVQFHPEKSHRFGMNLLTNFARL